MTTTGLIPKSGVWSYSESSDNAMPFAFGHQFRALGYRTMAFHDYLYTYYDRNLSHPNMGYEYYGIGNGLELEEVFPPSDLEMMEEIVPRFVDEDHFMVYCLTVSGHLNYNREGNVMSDRHYDEVAGLPYSEGNLTCSGTSNATWPASRSWSWPWRVWSASWRRPAGWRTR